MSTAVRVTESATTGEPRAVGRARSNWRDARYQAYMLMRLTFTVAPIAFGLDKFWNQMVYWPKYLAPGSTTSRPAAGRTSCTSSAVSRSSPGSSSS